MKKLIILAVFSYLPLLAHGDTPVQKTPQKEGLPVTLQRVETTLPADALIEATQQSTVAAQVTGRILEVLADAGSPVKKGALLMRIDAREAQESERAAQAAFRNSQANFQRTQDLVARKFMSQAALDKASAELETSKANLAATHATQGHASIISPLNGIIASRHAEVGDMSTPGKPLFTIYQPGTLRATVNVPQYQLQQLRTVSKAKVEFPELGKWVDGLSVTLLPTAESTTHTSQVRINLPNLADVTPGMFARVHFITGHADKLLVPATAIVRRGEVAAVYVQHTDQRLTLRQVRLGEARQGAQGKEFEILAGLNPGETIAANPAKAATQLKSPLPAR